MTQDFLENFGHLTHFVIIQEVIFVYLAAIQTLKKKAPKMRKIGEMTTRWQKTPK